jgi:surfactin synthase thioesterase subunit
VQPGNDRWVLTVNARSGDPRIRLICFPYAGGSPELFRAWADGLPDEVELLAVRLPGRGCRIREERYDRWGPLLVDTYTALAPYLREPHAFYGHSFGARLAYELTHLTQARHPGRTRWLFVSGCRSPSSPPARPYLHELPDSDFRAALREMGGTPAELLDSSPLLRLLLPTVYSEIRLAELWGDWHQKGVSVPITAMYGRDDPLDTRASMRGWRDYSQRDSELVEMPGDHFFVETHHRMLLDVISSRLEVARA